MVTYNVWLCQQDYPIDHLFLLSFKVLNITCGFWNSYKRLPMAKQQTADVFDMFIIFIYILECPDGRSHLRWRNTVIWLFNASFRMFHMYIKMSTYANFWERLCAWPVSRWLWSIPTQSFSNVQHCKWTPLHYIHTYGTCVQRAANSSKNVRNCIAHV